MAAAAWALSPAQREDTVARVAANICGLCHAKGIEVSDEVGRKAALAIEPKAYTAAEVSARTTTGARPLAETTKAYAR